MGVFKWRQESKNYVVKSLKLLLVIIPTALCLAIAIYLWRHAQSRIELKLPKEETTVAVQPKQIVKAKRRTLSPPKGITVIDKEEVSRYLKMPALTTTPGDVLAVATVPKSDSDTTAIVKLLPEGNTEVILRKEARKVWELKKEYRLSARYLFAGRNLVEADLEVNPIRLGPVDIIAGVGAEVSRYDSSFAARGWVGFEYKF